MVLAIVVAVVVMMFAARPIGEFVDRHPDGEDAGALVPDTGRRGADRRGLGLHIPKGYIYFAMAFSVGVEMLNIRVRARRRDAVSCAGKARTSDACDSGSRSA